MRYVIIGASAAGLTAAKTIRQQDKEGTITVISVDTQVYSRVMLHQYLSGARTSQELRFVPGDFFETNQVQWLPGKEVTKINTGEKFVRLSDGTQLSYDKLLIASGAEYVVPPLPHFREAKNVYGLRNLSDAEAILKAVEEGASRCVIVGSGLVGLDAASALCAHGISCQIVEMADRLSPLQLDETASNPYQTLFESKGCKFYLSEKAVDSELNSQGAITSISLASGTTLACDFVVVAAGVRPNIGFLEGSGIALDRRITVDPFMKTNVDSVWAAGDVAGIVGRWPTVMQQGEVAAKNMCGGEFPYEDKNGSQNRMNYYGLSTVSIGESAPEAGDEIIIRQGEGFYWKGALRDGVPVYMLLQGDVSKAAFFQKLIKNKTSLTRIQKALFDLSPADL